jgi:hypothetical protein
MSSYLRTLVSVFADYLLPVLVLLIPLRHLLGGGRALELVRPAFWREFLARYLNRRVLGGFLVALICMPVFYATYRDWKTAFPVMVPFYFDAPLELADRWLHGGRHPWEWLQGLIGRPVWTHVIDNAYVFWFEVQFAVVLWMAFSSRRWLRARFFISYIMMYFLLGHVMALLFASAGPVYFNDVVAGATDPFGPLMSYLESINEMAALNAIYIQETLWAGYSGTYDGPISGISAFPSVHVAVVSLFVLVGVSVNRVLGVLLFAFLVVTMVGSVHLGWHYALDGYVSMLAVAGLWVLSGPLTRRFFDWAGLDALGDPSAPPDLRGVDPGASETEADDGAEREHGRLVKGGRERRPQPSMP